MLKLLIVVVPYPVIVTNKKYYVFVFLLAKRSEKIGVSPVMIIRPHVLNTIYLYNSKVVETSHSCQKKSIINLYRKSFIPGVGFDLTRTYSAGTAGNALTV